MSFHRKIAGAAFALTCMAAPTLGQAQVEDPVSWTFSSRKVSPTVTELHMTATIEAGWHIYSQNMSGGPVATRFTFAKNAQALATGAPKEIGRLVVANEPAFGRTRYYQNTVDFVQRVARGGGGGPTTVRGRVEYMTANDHEALPPRARDFAIKID